MHRVYSMNISCSWLSEYFLHLSLFQVFFFKAQYKTGDIELSGEYSDHVWVTKEEMETYVDPDFYKVVKRFVYWWETRHSRGTFFQPKIDTVKETCPERERCMQLKLYCCGWSEKRDWYVQTYRRLCGSYTNSDFSYHCWMRWSLIHWISCSVTMQWSCKPSKPCSTFAPVVQCIVPQGVIHCTDLSYYHKLAWCIVLPHTPICTSLTLTSIIINVESLQICTVCHHPNSQQLHFLEGEELSEEMI